MIGAAWRWLAGTRVGRRVLGAVAMVAAVVLVRLDAYRDGQQDERREHEQADQERAKGVRHRAEDARRDAADDGRDADQRLRDHGRLRD